MALMIEPPSIPADWLAEFESAAKRPLALRWKYAFIKTYKPVMDDARFRAFDSMEEYRQWCEANLPRFLGYQRVDYLSNGESAMTPTALVNEVVSRLKSTSSATAHKSYLYDEAGIGCEILHREGCLEAVWSLRRNRESADQNHARADEIERQINDLLSIKCFRRRLEINDYVGFAFPVPIAPESTFFEKVAEGARFILRCVDMAKVRGI